jgi:DNA polymerase delta subunit 1
VERFYKALAARYAKKMHFKAQLIMDKTANPKGMAVLTDYDHRFMQQYLSYKDNWLRGYSVEPGRSLLYYSIDRAPYMKIYTAYPQIVGELRSLIDCCLGGAVEKPYWTNEIKKIKGKEKSLRVRKFRTEDVNRWLPKELGNVKIPIFEANVGFLERFSIDTSIYPCYWHSVAAECYTVIPSWHEKRVASTSLEVRVDYRAVKKAEQFKLGAAATPVKEEDAHPQLLELCFDIEARPPEDGSFPKPKNDSVLNIGVASRLSTAPNVRIVDIFMWGSSPPPRNLDPERQVVFRVHSFRYEEEQLLAFILFVTQGDFDRIYDYNGNGFDFPYLYKRCTALGMLPEFQKLGRLYQKQSYLRKTEFLTRASGYRKSYFLGIAGRLQADVFLRVLREQMRSHSLGAAAAKFLGDQKEEMGYGNIRPCSLTPEGRQKLAEYVQKDATLPFDLSDALEMMLELVCFCRVLGVQIASLLARGKVFQVHFMILRETKQLPENMGTMFVPVTSASSSRMQGKELLTRDATYTGATVVEPKKGHYPQKTPVAVEDFSSLYPSIMQAHNLCFSTLLEYTPDPAYLQRLKLTPQLAGTKRPYSHIPEYIQEDSGGKRLRCVVDKKSDAFVDARVQEGILPRVVRILNEKRQAVKDEMKVEKDPAKRKVLDKRQLALKILANSAYGGTGAEFGLLMFEGLKPHHVKIIAKKVTQVGRDTIWRTRAHVLNHFQQFDVDVIYGDTDSVFLILRQPGLSLDEQLQIFGAVQDSINEHICHEDDPDTGARVQWGPMSIVFEKVYLTMLLFQKKRYIGMKALPYRDKETGRWKLGPAKMEGTGMETKRRDNAPFVPYTLAQMLGYMLEKDDLPAAIHFLRQQIIKYTRMQDVSWENVIISRGLTRKLEDYTGRQIHVELAKRIAKADPAAAPKPGSGRIHYVVVQRNGKKTEKGELALDAWNKRMPLDSGDYVNNQLFKCTKRLLAPVLEESAVVSIFAESVRAAGGVSAAGKEIHNLSSAWKSFGKRYRCIVQSCSNFVPAQNDICEQCASERVEVERQAAAMELEKRQKERAVIHWRCNHECLQKQQQEAISCMNQECPVFWVRMKNDRDVERASSCFSKLQQAADSAASVSSFLDMEDLVVARKRTKLSPCSVDAATTAFSTSSKCSPSTVSLTSVLGKRKQQSLAQLWKKRGETVVVQKRIRV